MKEFKIHDELKNLLPPLSAAEYAGLEESILEYGCLTPLVMWHNVIVDGHYRYEICRKHNIPFATRKMKFADLDAAKDWAWHHQENRRNMTPYQRAELVLKFKDVIAKKAKTRQEMARHTTGPLPGTPIKTAVELAKFAEISHDTFRKAEFIASLADEETKEKLRRGDKGTSINREYNRLKIEKAKVPVMVTPMTMPQPKIFMDDEKGTLLIRNDATPEELATFLVEHFPADFVRSLIRSLLKWYDNRYGNEATQQFLLKTSVEYIN